MNIVRIIELLKYRFREDDTYVSGDLLLYYVEGDPRTFIVPDAFIVTGGGKHRRRTYKLWEEGRPPNIAFEVTSLSTRQNDIDKFAKYQQIGVKELFLYDPTSDYLTPPLQGFELGPDDYHAIPRDDRDRIHSNQLRADLCLEDADLVIYDTATLADGRRSGPGRTRCATGACRAVGSRVAPAPCAIGQVAESVRYRIWSTDVSRSIGYYRNMMAPTEFPLAICFTLADGSDVADRIPPQALLGSVRAYIR